MKKSQEEAAQELRDALAAAGVALDYASSDGGGFRITDGDEADYIVLLVRYSEWTYHVNYVSNVPNRLDEPIARLNDAADVAAVLKSRIERVAA